jgi:hypothetical protein
MKRSSGPRKTANLSESIHHQLNVYALAASAAGVGALALALPAEAKIVYTPSDTVIGFSHSGLRLDLNHDHVVDFVLHHSSGSSFTSMWVGSYHHRSTNLVVAKPGPFGPDARALRAGVSIGPAITFATNSIALMGQRLFNANGTTSQFNGPWANGGKGVKNHYLGLKFVIRGKVHYGWARLTVTPNGKFFTETLTGYAYETIPGKAIIAGATKGADDAEPTADFSSHTPEPATLGMLALGAPGLSIWRRKETALQGN